MFKFSNATYNLRNKREFVSDYVKTVYFGTESHSYVGQKIIGSFPSGLQTINVTSIRIKSQKMVPAKLPLSYMQFINPGCWFYKILT